MPKTDTSALTLDDETSAALILFNEYVEADLERTRRDKKVKKAERAKDEAAALVRKLTDRGSPEERAKAESAYREAAERWKSLRTGKQPEEVEDQQPSVADVPSEPKADAEEDKTNGASAIDESDDSSDVGDQ